MQFEIGVVVPVYNNELSLKELNERISLTLRGINHKVLYINDCSSDTSSYILESISREYPNVTVCNLKENIGQQRATLQGIKMIEANKIVVLDADLQDRPELILNLYDHCKGGATVFIKRKGAYQSLDRMVTSLMMKLLIQFLSGLNRKAGSYYMFDHSIKGEVIDLSNRCPTPYLTIIVSRCSTAKVYIESTRKKSNYQSNYTVTRRLQSAKQAFNCAIFCVFRS